MFLIALFVCVPVFMVYSLVPTLTKIFGPSLTVCEQKEWSVVSRRTKQATQRQPEVHTEVLQSPH